MYPSCFNGRPLAVIREATSFRRLTLWGECEAPKLLTDCGGSVGIGHSQAQDAQVRVNRNGIHEPGITLPVVRYVL